MNGVENGFKNFQAPWRQTNAGTDDNAVVAL
jgi:hypothetical protein